jgi:hypothetical protein
MTSSLNHKFVGELAKWGGPPGPRPTPTSAFVSRVIAEPDQWSGADEGVRPTTRYVVNFDYD